MMSMLMSHMKVIKIGQIHILLPLLGFLMTTICDIQIDLLCLNLIVSSFLFVNLLHSQVNIFNKCVKVEKYLHIGHRT